MTVVEQCIPLEEFRKALGDAPAGIFTQDAWIRWHKKLGIGRFRHYRGAGFQMARWDQNLDDSSGDRLLREPS